ncbi:hypothetical protein GCM10012279_58730 [Micromonospora yangpuensis]|nr:hypothetical protein GCM10012279_58730 [Micromonospora yangpuensis]
MSTLGPPTPNALSIFLKTIETPVERTPGSIVELVADPQHPNRNPCEVPVSTPGAPETSVCLGFRRGADGYRRPAGRCWLPPCGFCGGCAAREDWDGREASE